MIFSFSLLRGGKAERNGKCFQKNTRLPLLMRSPFQVIPQASWPLTSALLWCTGCLASLVPPHLSSQAPVLVSCWVSLPLSSHMWHMAEGSPEVSSNTQISGFPVPSRESGLYWGHINLFPQMTGYCLNYCRPKMKKLTLFKVMKLYWYFKCESFSAFF